MNLTPYVSIIIPTYNRKVTLLKCLKSLESQSYPLDEFEVIVVDDGSSDGTFQLVEEYSKKSRIKIKIIAQKNAGPGLARNLGVQNSAGDILGFTEDDISIGPKWIANAVQYFSSDDVDGLEGKTLEQDTDESLRAFEKEYRIGFLPCNMFVRKSVVIDIGGYDGNFFDANKKIYFREDADFGFAIMEKFYKFILAEDVVVYHPAQFFKVRDYYRHVRRYYFDPLLYRKHPKLYRKMIEVKNIGTITIRRPFHYSAVLNILNWLVIGIALYLGQIPFLSLCIPVLFLTHIAMRYRYEKKICPPIWKLDKTIAFIGLPFYYIFWLLRGCFKFKGWKCIL
jgi:glycosyltransferase involved in cell wall biosynthesis